MISFLSFFKKKMNTDQEHSKIYKINNLMQISEEEQ